jgi:adenylate kinase family enzyme
VVGSGGAGKSTFARRLSAITGLPVIHLDRHYWKAGWVPTPSDEWNAMAAELAERPEWIMDGNYGGSLSLRVPRCDAVVFFDFPRIVCLWGVVKRRFRFSSQSRPDMAEGCHERLSLEFLWWIWRYPKRSRQRIIGALAKARSDVEVIRVERRRAVDSLLEATRHTLAMNGEPRDAR